MPRMEENHRNVSRDAKYFREAKASLKRRTDLLSFFDYCFYSIAFCLLTITPVNAKVITDDLPLNIYAAHLSHELASVCLADGQIDCQLNIVDQATLLSSLLAADEPNQIIDALRGDDYELLVGSASIQKTVNKQLSSELIFEITTQWRGISINESQLSINIDNTLDKLSNTPADRLSAASSSLLSKWMVNAAKQNLFSAEHLYNMLGASDYTTELKVPRKIGGFELARQHLFNDPMQGMLTRYIHKDFDLAVLDVYVYPLQVIASVQEESLNELRREQRDIKTISQSLGENALTMSDVSEVEGLQGIGDIKVYGFEATVKTNSDPLFATQYLFVKNDKIVKLSANVPARIADSLVALAVNAIEVPAESLLMKQVRQLDLEQANGLRASRVAP